MALKHENPNYADRTGVAPYNFVPLPENILKVDAPPPQDRYSGYSGYFECELETSSPTYIRGMLTEAEINSGKQSREHPAPFAIDDETSPVLPGSSLRGMFRNLIEIISYSKMAWVTQQKPVYRSVGDTTSHGMKYRQRIMKEEVKNHFIPLMRGGYLRNHQGRWFIHPAEEINGTTFARIPISKIPRDLKKWHESKNASSIYVHPGPFDYQEVRGGFLHIKYSKTLRASATPDSGLHKAVLTRSGRMIKKNSEAIIFQPDPAKSTPDDWVKVSPEIVRAYTDQISKEQISLLGDQGVLVDNQPIFYLMEDGKLVFFGHTMMLRMTYTNSPQDLIPERLRRQNEIDLAEAMFGFIEKKDGDGKNLAYAGRLFFSDAHCLPDQDKPIEAEISPQILASPNPTSFQLYLMQPFPDDKKRLRDYDDNTHLRGHKLYWHKGKRSSRAIAEQDENKLKEDQDKPVAKQQFTKIRPIRPGIKFSFVINFENLTEIELGALSWILQQGANPVYRFKLGMGKPLGMGSVQITSNLHLYDRESRYQNLWSDNGTWNLGDKSAVSQTQASAVEAFTNWVLEDRDINPGAVDDFSQLYRIRTLLAMLSWPGPDPELTRYMEIEHPDPTAKRGKRNEYRERSVLPSPDRVELQPVYEAAPNNPYPNVPLDSPQVVSEVSITPKVSESNVREVTEGLMKYMADKAAEEETEPGERGLSQAERRRLKRKQKRKK